MKTRVLTVFALFGSLALSSAQTISNPSFESNSFTVFPGYISSNTAIVGWTTTETNYVGLNPASGNPFADNGTVPDGTNVAFIQGNTNLNSSLSTVISNLIVGETYKVNFRVNAQTNVGGMPNLNVWIDATNVVNSTVTPVAPMGFPGPYKYFAFDFTAAATNQTMTLSNDAPDQTVLVDNFSIALRNSGWSYAAWSNDASSGVFSNRFYTHAFAFGTSASPVINGVHFTGIPGPNPSNGVFSTTGLPNVYNNDTNYLTSGGGGSGVLAGNFLYGGAVESITLQGLTVGKSYVATIYSVGFDASGTRAATFSAGNDLLTVNQDQFGYYNGIRVSCRFTANAPSNTLTYVPLNIKNTFHTYGFSVYQVSELVVTNAADSGPGSLRQLVSQADPFTLITFTNTLSGQTIVLTGGQLTLYTNVTIDASSLPAGVTVSGNHSSVIFEVSAGTTVTMNSLTLINGYAGGSIGYGGAILVDSGATLTLNATSLSGNTATNGGGIANYGALTLNNSTLSGNSATPGGDGGGILNLGTLTLNNSTLSGNSGYYDGGGIYSDGTLTINNSTVCSNSLGGPGSLGGGIYISAAGPIPSLTNTIVAGNFSTGSLNIYGSYGGANNLVDVNPLLAPLGTYGGPTQTMPPLTGSPAIDAGSDAVTNFLATDQRGFPRRIGLHVDIGSAEYFASPLVTTNADGGSGSLRNAAVYATNGAAITFTNTLSGQTIVLTGGQLTINQNITIDGSSLPAGIALSGHRFSRIFEVSPGATLGLNALTLTNAASIGNGGAILVDAGGTLTLNNSTLSGNAATENGGALGNFAGMAIISNSAFSDNSAFSGGAIENDNGTLVISASTLSGNVATNVGGAIDNDAGALLRLDNSTLAGNSTLYIGGGGGIENSQATAIISASTLSGNASATNGGAIDNDAGALLRLDNSTLAGNSASSNGGGIDNDLSAVSRLNNSTLSGNSAAFGGGIYNSAALFLTNTIVAGNSASNAFANVDSAGYTSVKNLTDVNPLLAPLGTYGGPTQTMPPLTGSPAIDAGTDSVTNSLATDQRGFPRLSGSHVDIGAVEVQFVAVPADNPPVLKNVLWTSAGGSNTFQFSFTNVPSADFTALASTNVSLPLSNWTVLGNIPEISSGQYQFTDSATTNYPRRFYQVVSP